MSTPPAYYESVREGAAKRWVQLEQDKELAGPWHQLFKQVQSPRHVLSELLQNADDAGATEASVRVEDQKFIFEHNGDDFSEEHFASLCRFGYSSKRALHTIGFRGVGFKSTFSLGDCVKLFTPSLSICFNRNRFTEPHWLSEEFDTKGKTCITVEISDNPRRTQVERNFDEWLASPLSLLFFNNIRQLQIADRVVFWEKLDSGPVSDSEWMSLNEDQDQVYLLVRSGLEEFPKEALDEIRQERMLDNDDDCDLHSCKIEIVLGAKGRLYVVLPTGVETTLPFACNAPFVQDPARLKIKEPEFSPTNLWLLKRIGSLAASTMFQWLGKTEMSTTGRAEAYNLLPDVNRDDGSLEGLCGAKIEEEFDVSIETKPLLLTECGDLTIKDKCVAIPKEIIEIWSAKQATTILDKSLRPALTKHVDQVNLTKLLNWEVIELIDKKALLIALESNHLPRPDTWKQLLNLWVYVAPEIEKDFFNKLKNKIRIVPVQGQDNLYSSSEVVRLGEKKLLQSENDWKYLANYLIVLNPNWPRFLADQRRTASEHNDKFAKTVVETAYSVLEKLGLNTTSDTSKVIDQVAEKIFSQNSIGISECVQLAQIAAKFGATVSNSFQFVTSDNKRKPVEKGILFDDNGTLGDLLPEQERLTNVLHASYSEQNNSCSREDWLRWVSSGRAKLLSFIPLKQSNLHFNRRSDLDRHLKQNGFIDLPQHEYKNPSFDVCDWNFKNTYWEYWENIKVENPAIWASIAERIFAEKESYWSSTSSLRIIERASNGNERKLNAQGMNTSWVTKFRDLPCLPDMRKIHRKPHELLRRTPATESLIYAEDFVHNSLDIEVNQPLLDLIGVRNTPTGPDRILNCLRALSNTESPPVHEVEKWYNLLDQFLDHCPTEDFEKIRKAFKLEKLILTQNGVWEASPGVFLAAKEDDVPDVEIIRGTVTRLALWRKIGVADRPTTKLAIDWLRSLPVNSAVGKNKLRICALLARFPNLIWEETRRWLNVVDEWVPIDELHYSLTMQNLLDPWEHLFQSVKQQTANFRMLTAETAYDPPFSQVPTLAARVEERLCGNEEIVADAISNEWLTVLGRELCRIKLDTEDETHRVKTQAERLAHTKWHETQSLEITPYIDGKPAGTPCQKEVLWLNQTLYVKNSMQSAKLAKLVPDEIGKFFDRPDIKSALDYSFGRPTEAVREYLVENFSLHPVDPLETSGESTGQEGGLQDEPISTNKFGGNQETGNSNSSNVEGARDSGSSTDSNQVGNNNIQTKSLRQNGPVKSYKPEIIERFFTSRGFKKESENLFTHKDGSRIVRYNDHPFPWRLHSAVACDDRSYWSKDHCWEHKPLQLEADKYHLIEENPDTYSLVLADNEGNPIEVTGHKLSSMKDKGKIVLYPAAYRLVFKYDSRAQ